MGHILHRHRAVVHALVVEEVGLWVCQWRPEHSEAADWEEEVEPLEGRWAAVVEAVEIPEDCEKTGEGARRSSRLRQSWNRARGISMHP